MKTCNDCPVSRCSVATTYIEVVSRRKSVKADKRAHQILRISIVHCAIVILFGHMKRPRWVRDTKHCHYCSLNCPFSARFSAEFIVHRASRSRARLLFIGQVVCSINLYLYHLYQPTHTSSSSSATCRESTMAHAVGGYIKLFLDLSYIIVS